MSRVSHYGNDATHNCCGKAHLILRWNSNLASPKKILKTSRNKGKEWVDRSRRGQCYATLRVLHFSFLLIFYFGPNYHTFSRSPPDLSYSPRLQNLVMSCLSSHFLAGSVFLRPEEIRLCPSTLYICILLAHLRDWLASFPMSRVS